MWRVRYARHVIVIYILMICQSCHTYTASSDTRLRTLIWEQIIDHQESLVGWTPRNTRSTCEICLFFLPFSIAAFNAIFDYFFLFLDRYDERKTLVAHSLSCLVLGRSLHESKTKSKQGMTAWYHCHPHVTGLCICLLVCRWHIHSKRIKKSIA